MDEGGVRADDEGDRAQGVAGREHHAHGEPAEVEALAVGEQPVEVPVDVEGRRQVVEALPELGDLAHLGADRGRRAELLLEIGGGHEVVGVGMGVEIQAHLEPLGGEVGEDRIGRGGAGARRPEIEVPDDVDQRGLAGRRVAYHVLDAAGVGLVKADDLGRTLAL